MAKALKTVFEEKNIEISEKQLELFEGYRHLLVEKNKVMNLTAIEEEEEVNYKHFLDSVLPLTMVEFKKNASFIDIGTGAGFPAVPMKIMRPDIKMTLLDSLNKLWLTFWNEQVDPAILPVCRRFILFQHRY